MASLFDNVAKVAIERIILEEAEESKFGYFLSKEALEEAVKELLLLLKTSQRLKTAGDKILPQPDDTTG